MKRRIDPINIIFIICAILIFVIGAVMSIIQPIQESRSYNRLTGAHTTPWDAFWLDLRVQDTPK